jgi:methionine synthase I (cobalamin-dependent)
MSTRLDPALCKLTVADGGWSTILRERGLDPQQPAELANLTHPAMVEQLARDYIAAGAQVIMTNTFSATRSVFEKPARSDWREVSAAGVELARKAAARTETRVAGSIGPSGKIIAIREVDPEQVADAFRAQALVLTKAGADLLVLETFTELAELLLAVRSIREATHLPVIASLSFDSGPQRTQTLMGAEAAQCAIAIEEAGADAVGFNCGAGVEFALPAVVALRANTALPLWVKPSVGLPDLKSGRPVYYQTPENFCEHMPQLIDAGATILGGCCGAGPEHIRRLAAIVRSRTRADKPGRRPG